MPRLIPATAPPATPWQAEEADDDYGVPGEPNWREVDWPELERRLRPLLARIG